MKKILLPMIALILFLVACSEANNTDSQESEERVTPVEVSEVTQEDLVIEKQFFGRTMPESTTPVVPLVAGEVDTLEVSKGDQVEEDDVIATITRADTGGKMDILASVDGEVTTLNAQEGGIVSNTEAMAMIVNMENITVQVDVTADNLKIFDDVEEAMVQFNTLDGEYTADIDYVSSVANETGLYSVELSLENEDNKIKPGMVAVVQLPENIVEDTLIIPTTALVEQEDETFVYVVKEDKAVKTTVTVVESQTGVTAIEAEISAGDTVVTSGQLTLSDGNQVSIMKEEQ